MATERILPAAAFPVPARSLGRRSVPVAATTVASRGHVQTAVRPAVQRKEALLNTPSRAAMLIGVSAAVYAVTLAGVAGLQSGSDAELAARNLPLVTALADRRAADDRLAAQLAAVDARLQSLGTAYDSAGQSVTTYVTRLDALAALVAEVQVTAAAVPARISLPTVSLHGAISGGTASAGGGSVASSGSTATTSKPPATTATTTASGKP